MKNENTSLLNRLGLLFAKYRLRAGRGNALTSELKGIVVLFAAGSAIFVYLERVTDILFPWWSLLVFWVIQKVAEVAVAWFDEKKMKWWQIENEYLSRHVNPFNAELMDRIKRIQEKLDEHTKRDT
jgi:hypothetical protein